MKVSLERSATRRVATQNPLEETSMSSDATLKAARQTMRRIQEHLRSAHLNLGANDEALGFVDVIYHSQTALASLNYVMPRRSTAHVPNKHIENGLASLRTKQRTARVYFADGLYPPMFVGGLRDLGLMVERETPMMVFQRATLPPAQTLPAELSLVPVTDQQSLGIWWYVWRNAYYEVLAAGVEPLLIGRDLRSLTLQQHLDLILYRYGFPAGVIRVTLHEKSAHIAACALMKELRSPDLMRALQMAGIQAALERGCDLIFADGETDEDRQLYRDLGFEDSGSMITYAEGIVAQPAPKEQHAILMTQPILVL
jgi:hypothetical protein